MKKKSILALILTLALCFGLIGCGGTPDLEMAVNKPMVSSDGVEVTLTSMKADVVFLPGYQTADTFEFEVKAVNNTGDEDPLYNVGTFMTLYGPDGKEVDHVVKGTVYRNGQVTSGFDKPYEDGNVRDGGYKEYTIGFPDPGLDGDYVITFGFGDYEYEFHFNVEHLSEKEGGTTIKYPTMDGEAVYQASQTE